jgi:hypothetical protein
MVKGPPPNLLEPGLCDVLWMASVMVVVMVLMNIALLAKVTHQSHMCGSFLQSSN